MNSLGPWCQSQRSERSKEVGGISPLPQAIAGEGDLVLMTMVRCHVGEQWLLITHNDLVSIIVKLKLCTQDQKLSFWPDF